MRWLAQRATTREWLHFDLPLESAEVTRSLSAAGSLTATVDPSAGALLADDGRPLLDEWSTALYAEDGGAIRWGGIVAVSRPDGDSWHVEAIGHGGYPHERRYFGDYASVGIDAVTVIRDLWAYVQAAPGGDLGVEVIGGPSGVLLGDRSHIIRDGARYDFEIPHKQFQQLYESGWPGQGATPRPGGYAFTDTTPDDLLSWLIDYARFTDLRNGLAARNTTWTGEFGLNGEFSGLEVTLLDAGWTGGPISKGKITQATAEGLTSRGWSTREGYPDDQLWPPALNGRTLLDGDEVVERAPYRIASWEAKNIGDEIAALCKQANLEWAERFAFDGDTVTPQIYLGSRLGAVRDDLLIAQDENATSVTFTASLGDDHANHVVILGDGEGRRMKRGEAVAADGRLRRDFVESTDSSTAPLDQIAARELKRRTGSGVAVSGAKIADHPHAPFGAFDVGDTILVRAQAPHIGNVEQWARITSWTHSGDEVALVLEPAERTL